MAEERVALVTGAGRGIGRATVLELARRGLRVFGVARTRQQLESLSQATGADVLTGSVDTPDGCARISEQVLEAAGRVDVLVNNAGVLLHEEQPIWEQDPQVWRRTLAVNLDGAFELTRLLAAGMVRRGSGRIVMVASTAGQIGGPSASAYCASKHGMLGLMRAAAHDVAPYGVTCNAVCPGWVRTHMGDGAAEYSAMQRGIDAEDVWEERAALYPAGRVVQPEEVAAAVAFLAGDSASGINGEALTVALGGVW